MRRGTQACIQFGLNLKNTRVRQGLTMHQVAKSLGVHAATVSQIEKAQRALKEDKIAAWAKALGVKEDWLRHEWHHVQKVNPEPPLLRTRHTSIRKDELKVLIDSLSSVDRNKVIGYIDGLLDSK